MTRPVMKEQHFVADASFDGDREAAGLGVAYRAGRIICGEVVRVGDLQSAELLAVLRAIEIAARYKHTRTTIHTDASVVVDAINGSDCAPTGEFALLMEDVDRWIEAFGFKITVDWLPRDKTRAAHIVAGQTYKAWLAGQRGGTTWLSPEPPAPSFAQLEAVAA